jgi:hypothetical protein
MVASLQQKPGVGAPPVYRPVNAAAAAPAVYRSNMAASLQRKPGVTAPPVYRPGNTAVAAPNAQNRRAPAVSPLQRPVQRKVVWESLFHDYDEVGGNPDAEINITKWVEFQAARRWYENADKALSATIGSLLPKFENEPKLTLVITEDPRMKWEHLGETYMQVWVGHWETVGSDNEDIWTGPLSEGAYVNIIVAITPGETAEKTAHTLNHEMALHATKFLKFTRRARTMEPGDIGQLGRSMLQNYCCHHKKIKDPGHRVNETHAKLMASSGSFSPASLKMAYFDDYEMYDDQGVTREPREGHADREEGWVLDHLSARSPVAKVAIGETEVVYYRQLRIRVHREAEKQFKLWFENGQKNPYYVQVVKFVD